MTGHFGNTIPNMTLSFLTRPIVASSSRRHHPHDNLGLLAVLPEEPDHQEKKYVLTSSSTLRNSSSTVTWHIPTGPKHEDISVSAPVKVPVARNGIDVKRCILPMRSPCTGVMIPPHEMMAESSRGHSVLEGAGRTLKGRDLRSIRDVVHHVTGFPG